MSASGHKRQFGHVRIESDIATIADIAADSRYVGFVPAADIRKLGMTLVSVLQMP